jgi:hypothetical protein
MRDGDVASNIWQALEWGEHGAVFNERYVAEAQAEFGAAAGEVSRKGAWAAGEAAGTLESVGQKVEHFGSSVFRGRGRQIQLATT